MRRVATLHLPLNEHVVLLGLLACIGIFHVATLREGFSWFGDAPSYVHHAQNIVQGRPYAEIGYIQNPEAFLAPQAYPPGFPLAMAPIIAIWGTDVDALRIEVIFFFLIALYIMARLFNRALPFPALCGLIVVVGMHPVFWSILQRLTPDVLFLLIAYLSLWAYTKAQEQGHSDKEQIAWGLLAGGFVCCAILTRTIGLILLPCFLGYDLVRHRRLSRSFFIMAGMCVLFYGTWTLFFSSAAVSDGGYGYLVQEIIINRFGDAVRNLPSMFMRYARSADNLWTNGYSRFVQHVFFLGAAPFVLAGFGYRLLRRRSVLEMFSLFYLAALLPWTFSKMRYFIPLIPLYYFYLFVGAGLLLGWLRSKEAMLAKGPVLVVGLMIILGSYLAKYTTLEFGPERSTFTSPAAIAFYEHVRRLTAPGDVFIAEFPRQIAFFTDRPTSLPYRAEHGEKLFDYFRKIDAEYLVIGPPEEVMPWRNLRYSLKELIQQHPSRFEQVYANGKYELYRFTSE